MIRIVSILPILLYSGFSEACNDDQFTCENDSIHCVPLLWVCDGRNDCQDGSDERTAQCHSHSAGSPCYGNQPECVYLGVKRCIRDEWLCDGNIDCDSGDDEKNCTIIDPMQKVLLTDSPWRAAGVAPMATTEKMRIGDSNSTVEMGLINNQNRSCYDFEFRCVTGGECIIRDLLCDDRKDCPDGSDENEDRCATPPRLVIEPSKPIEPETAQPSSESASPEIPGTTAPESETPAITTVAEPTVTSLELFLTTLPEPIQSEKHQESSPSLPPPIAPIYGLLEGMGLPERRTEPLEVTDSPVPPVTLPGILIGSLKSAPLPADQRENTYRYAANAEPNVIPITPRAILPDMSYLRSVEQTDHNTDKGAHIEGGSEGSKIPRTAETPSYTDKNGEKVIKVVEQSQSAIIPVNAPANYKVMEQIRATITKRVKIYTSKLLPERLDLKTSEEEAMHNSGTKHENENSTDR